MDFNDILTLLGSYCFPIIACIALFWKSFKDEQLHKDEVGKLTEAVNNNSTLLQQILVYLQGGGRA